jgi:hypothetical protein
MGGVGASSVKDWGWAVKARSMKKRIVGMLFMADGLDVAY